MELGTPQEFLSAPAVSPQLRPTRIGSLVRFRIQDVQAYGVGIQVKIKRRPKSAAGGNTFDLRTLRQGLAEKVGPNSESPELENPS